MSDSELQIEKALLALILVNGSKSNLQQLVTKVDKTYFSSEITQWVYEIISTHFFTYAEVPTKTVFKTALASLEDPKKTEIKTVLASIYSMSIKVEDFDFLLNRVVQQKRYGELLKTVTDSISDISVDNVDSKLDSLFIKISQLTSTTSTNTPVVRRFDMSENILDQLTRLEETTTFDKGIPTPIPELNEAIGGLKKQQLFIIAAPRGEGKSLLALNFVDYANFLGYNTLFFTIEMSYEDIESRRHSLITKIDADKILKHSLNEKDKRQFYREFFLRYIVKDQHEDFLTLLKKTDFSEFNYKNFYKEVTSKFKFKNNHFYVRDIPLNCTIARMKAELNFIQKITPIDLIVIDYLNILEPSVKTGGWNDMNQLARDLKGWAREDNMRIVTAAQLKPIEKREKLSSEDMRFAKAIGDHADWMLAFSRTDQDKLCGRIKFELIKHRFSAEKTIVVKEMFSKMMISGLIDDDEPVKEVLNDR